MIGYLALQGNKRWRKGKRLKERKKRKGEKKEEKKEEREERKNKQKKRGGEGEMEGRVGLGAASRSNLRPTNKGGNDWGCIESIQLSVCRVGKWTLTFSGFEMCPASPGIHDFL